MIAMRDFSSRDLERMTDLVRENYGEVEIAKKAFAKWQYLDNPAGPALVKLAIDQRTRILAGQYVTIPTRFYVAGTSMTASLSVNTLTRKEYRGRGIFTKLAKELFREISQKEISFTFGLPNPNSYHGFVTKLGFVDVGPVPLLLFPLDIYSLVKTKYGTLFALLTSPLWWLWKLPKAGEQNQQIVELTTQNVNLIDGFWEKIKNKYPVMQARDAKFMRWRYLEAPTRKYKAFMLRQDGEILGYVVGRIMDVDGVKSGMIADFLIANNVNEEVGKDLIGKLLWYFNDQGAQLVGSLALGHTQEFRILKRFGLFRCPQFLEPQPFRVVVKVLRKNGISLKATHLCNWFLTMGDYDVV